MQDSHVEKDVFGGVNRPEQGTFVMDPGLAKEPLCYQGTVTRCFCLNCGYSTELLPEAAEHLREAAGIADPINWADCYIEVDGCIICQKKHTKVSVHNIPIS